MESVDFSSVATHVIYQLTPDFQTHIFTDCVFSARYRDAARKTLQLGLLKTKKKLYAVA